MCISNFVFEKEKNGFELFVRGGGQTDQQTDSVITVLLCVFTVLLCILVYVVYVSVYMSMSVIMVLNCVTVLLCGV